MNKLLSGLFTVLFLTLICACGSDGKSDVPDVPTERTVLVYMVANNNLNYFATLDLDEMKEAAGSLPENVRWLVYYAPQNAAPVLQELKKNGMWKTLKTYPVTGSSVSLSRITEVLADSRSAAPAIKNGIILWSHASGWLQNGMSEPGLSTMSFGDDGGRYCNITTLRAALEQNKFEFIYADCCNFSSVEIAYELRDCADRFASSATRMPAEGMPYNLTLSHIAKGDIVLAAKTTIDFYRKKGGDNPFCTLSVINLTMMEELAMETKKAYTASTYPEGYQPAPQDMEKCYFFDLRHFIEALAPENISEWNDVFNKAVIYSDNLPYLAETDRLLAAHSGLTTYILNSSNHSTDKGYHQLEWYTDVARFQPTDKQE